ncbi:hypothetical protein T09_10993 [Trichinella sp. T9]|nr:hypothetical protein T09_10993 [Trichinella sp. T9]
MVFSIRHQSNKQLESVLTQRWFCFGQQRVNRN